MWQLWLIMAGVFFVGEMITVGFLIFWLGVAALIAMIVSFFTANLIVQTTIFVIFSALLILITKPFVKKFVDIEPVNTNASSIIGKKALVTIDINSIQSTGQIKINGETWSAESENHEIIPKNSEVEIVAIKGVKAIVKSCKVASAI